MDTLTKGSEVNSCFSYETMLSFKCHSRKSCKIIAKSRSKVRAYLTSFFITEIRCLGHFRGVAFLSQLNTDGVHCCENSASIQISTILSQLLECVSNTQPLTSFEPISKIYCTTKCSYHTDNTVQNTNCSYCHCVYVQI